MSVALHVDVNSTETALQLALDICAIRLKDAECRVHLHLMQKTGVRVSTVQEKDFI